MMLSATKAIRLALAAALVGLLCSLDGASAAARNHPTVGKRAASSSRNNDGQKKNAAAGLLLHAHAPHNDDQRRSLAHDSSEPTPAPTAEPTLAIVAGQPRQIGPGMTDEPTANSLTPEPTMAATVDTVDQMILEEFEEMVVGEVEGAAGTDQPTPVPTPEATPVPTPEATKKRERVTDEPTEESKSEKLMAAQ